MRDAYVHGYSEKEGVRLQDQAVTLVDLLHSDTVYPEGSSVLEAGCGVGAQTVILAKNSPGAKITAIDISESSLEEAKKRVESYGIRNVTFRQGDIFNLPFAPQSFDHVFICFVLEHLAEPVKALSSLKQYIRHGGSITVIEGDHGSAYFYPDSESAHTAIGCQVELQRRKGGNAMIGRALYPLMIQAGYENVIVSPRMVYVDAGRPQLVDGFIRKTFTAMIEGIRQDALDAGLIDAVAFDAGIRGLKRTTESDGVFSYTFFKAAAVIK
ncbi:MAG: methyltransferase domain-containing protein [Candidatus Auribacterota bacterium]